MKRLLISAIIISLSYATSAQNNSEIFQKSGFAINGYDPVAFFAEKKPVKGNPEYSLTWKAATWLFVSRANLDSFRIAPEKFAPQYGGYCAFGTAEGHKAPTEIDTWTMLDGKLYFNYNQKVKGMWDKDRQKYISQADVNWEKIKFNE